MSATPQLNPDRVDDRILRTMSLPGLVYLGVIGVLSLLVAGGVSAYTYQVYYGIGVTGLGQPVMWAFYITTFLFWISIGHAALLVSAVLYLFRSRWRPSIFRTAEVIAVAAAAVGGLFPIVHLGRPWFFYWLMFYPNERILQPDFHSPLVWDFFGVVGFLVAALIIFYVGAIPDFATIAESTEGLRSKIYRVLSLGWQGGQRQWRQFSSAYALFMGLAAAVAISADAVGAYDLAMDQQPGWHDQILAPYFLATALYSFLGIMFVILPMMRRIGHLEDEITLWHFNQLGKLALLVSLFISYAYLTESFMAWYSNDSVQRDTYSVRYFAQYSALFWLMCWGNCIMPLGLFWKRLRTNLTFIFVLGIFALVGVWLDYFVVIAQSLATNFMPSQWRFYYPTWAEILIEAASFALFFIIFLIGYKATPIVSITGLKAGLRWINQVLRGAYREAA